MTAGGEPRQPGATLITQEASSVRIMAKDTTNKNASALKEIGWQCDVVINNPLEVPAVHPRAEALIYGTDKRLWLAVLLNPEDEQLKSIITMDGKGPLKPHEKRSLNCNMYYYHLPTRLQQILIGRVEFLAFDAR